MNKRECGQEKERLTESYLKERGVRILCRNFRCRQGEIDLIGADGEYLVFFEVKYRNSPRFEDPFAAVGTAKQSKICRTADYYRLVKGVPADTPIRYDVVGICGETIKWMKNAFPHRGAGIV